MAKASAKASAKEKDVINTPADLDTSSKEVAEAPKKASSDALDVVVEAKNLYLRQFNEELHGEDFAALAQEFASKKPERQIVKASTIKYVFVNYREPDKFNKETGQPDADSRYVDKQEKFTDKAAAVEFAKVKNGTVVLRA